MDPKFKKGDMLLLPAFWLHQVEAVTASISVNVWTHSRSSMLVEEALWRPLPFHSRSWPQDKLRTAAQTFVPMVVAAVLDDPQFLGFWWVERLGVSDDGIWAFSSSSSPFTSRV